MAAQLGDETRYISTLRAADALGVSISTVKRWVDDGILPAHRTAGGHRRLLRADLLALARQGELPRRDLTSLSRIASFGDQPLDLESVSAALLTAVLRRDGTEVSALIRTAYHSGAAIAILSDRVIAPVLAKVGQQWECGRIDIWQEHQATQLCVSALYELKDELERRAQRHRPVAVGGAPEGDPYLLPTLLAQMVLLDAGWEPVNLGPDTPLTSLAGAMRELRPRLVWLSVSHLEKPADFLREYRQFYQAAEQIGVAVAVGGQALWGSTRSAMPYTTYGDRLNHLASFAQTLHPTRRPPRRGRPPKR